QLSHRYIPSRQLPDKAVSLLDTACARVAISQHATPAEVEDAARRIEALETELDIIRREEAVGEDGAARNEEGERQLATERGRHATLQARWNEEKHLVDRLLALGAQLRAQLSTQLHDTEGHDAEAGSDRNAQLEQLRELQSALSTLQGERPLILPSVD